MNILTSKTLFLVTCIAVITSCNNGKKSKLADYGKVVSAVMLKDKGTFRGHDLGESIDSVKAQELQQPMEVDDNFLYYEYKIDSTASFNISYNFDEKGLSEIQSDIFIYEDNSGENYFDLFKSYFSSYFGEGENQKGFFVWTVQSEKYGTVRINLSDESADFTVDNAPSKISLWIYPDKN
jgi:hypothetical protein